MKSFIAMIVAVAMCALVSIASAANVNTDSAEVIAKDLKGVGAKKAELIVSERANGDYKDGADLATRVKGIGPMTVEKNADMLDFGTSK